MKIDFCVRSKSDAENLISNKTELSLFLVKKFLNTIPNRLDVTNTIQHVEFEISAEGFLSFIINARDSLLQEINANLNLGFVEEQVSLRPLLEKLNSKGKGITKWRGIFNLLNDCTQEPEKVINYNLIHFWEWDRTKSWLWELEELRNRISHRSIIHRQIVISTTFSTKMTICEIAKQPILRASGKTQVVPIKNPKTELILEENPKDYFSASYSKFIKLKDDIRNLF